MPAGDNWYNWANVFTTNANCTTAVSTVWADWTTTSGTVTYDIGSNANTDVWTVWTQDGSDIWQYQRQIEIVQDTPDLVQSRQERQAAQRKAAALLRRQLTREQRQQFEETQAFEVTTPSGRRYRIRRGRSANIDVLGPNGEVTHRLCIHPGEMVPDEDTMVAQKLMLETAEADVLRIANSHPARAA